MPSTEPKIMGLESSVKVIETKHTEPTCQNCGNGFIFGSSRHGNRRKYCSDKCMDEFWDKNNPNYKKDYFKKNYIPHPVSDSLSHIRDNHKKGQALEDFVADELRINGLDHNARRTNGSGNGLEKGDVYNSLNLSIECKNQEKLTPLQWWGQCLRDSKVTHATPVLVFNNPKEPLENSSVMIEWSYFMQLLVSISNHRSSGEILDKYTIKHHLEQAIVHLKKVKGEV